MNFAEQAQPVQWRVNNPSPGAQQIKIAGWHFLPSDSSKPLMLMHHANGMCAALWATVAQKMTEHYNVFALDARGHGDSDSLTVPDDYAWKYFVSDLKEVADQLMSQFDQPQIAHGVGSSFGGIVTAACEAQYPGTFAQISMFDPPIHSTPEIVQQLGLDIEVRNTDDRDELVARTLRRRATFDSRQQAYSNWQDKPLFAVWQKEAFNLYIEQGMRETEDGQVTLKCETKVEAHIFATTGELAVLDFAPKVSVPVAFVHAKQGFFPEVFFRELATLFPQGQFYQIDAGHMLPLEAPDAVVELLLSPA